MQLTAYQHTCTRCGHTWPSFKERPARCPKCRNPRWDIPPDKRFVRKDLRR